jgi:pimeloyl-ACP methyl ester carboxylesterase
MRKIFLSIAVIFTLVQIASTQQTQAFRDPSPHKSNFIHVNGIRLHYLDWGGSGTPLILIHGIGDNAHIFDDLAPLLSDQFRVLAYSRRGHGHSDAPTGPYDLSTLVEDLKQFMDSLKVEKAHLLGWSMGGNEITQFAGRFPERVHKLVYLDSGYDWTDPNFWKSFGEILGSNVPNESTLSSLNLYRSWYRAFWFGNIPWTSGLESYLRDGTRISNDGKVQPIPVDKVFEPLFASLATPPRNYSKVRAPAIALYAVTFFPNEHKDPSIASQFNEFEQRVMVPFRRVSKERVKKELQNVIVKEIPETSHMSIGVYKTDSLASTIREFLRKD